MMYQKQNGLATNDENSPKIYIIEIKMVRIFLRGRGRKKTRGGEMKVSSIMLLKTKGGKMPAFCLAIMLMKSNELSSFCHYVDENKLESRWTEIVNYES